MSSLVTPELIAASTPEKIAANVRTLTHDAGLTPAEISRLLGMHRSQVTRRMNGETEWKPSELTTIAVRLKLSGSKLTR